MARKAKLAERHTKDEDERPIRKRGYRYFILIVCEDQNTEPYYFRSFIQRFPEGTVFLLPVGAGTNYIGVVQQAVNDREWLKEELRKEVDEVWAVFDRDDAHLSVGNTARFNGAFILANQEGIQIAYSNEAFELWLLLHLTDVDPNIPLGRQDIYAAIETHIRTYNGQEEFVYVHGDSGVVDVLNEIGNETLAIQYAKALDAHHQIQGNQPIQANPSTTVYKLVESLRSWIAYYS